MTTAQLDHLRRIDAHLANLLATAEKRTPGEWSHQPYDSAGESTAVVSKGFKDGVGRTVALSPHYGNFSQDAAFIAACSGNAEAGWKATRLAIKTLLEYTGPLTPQIEREYAKEKLGEIIALFPNV